jgi:ribosomal protein S27AE
MKTNVICPHCGTEMNHHADKVVYSSEKSRSEAILDETIYEVHACPNCGLGSSRQEDERL